MASVKRRLMSAAVSSALMLSILLLASCSSRPLGIISDYILGKTELVEIRDNMFSVQRTELHAEFSQRMGRGFQVLGVRDFVMGDQMQLAPTAELLGYAFKRKGNEVPKRCIADADRLERSTYADVRAYFIEDRCRFAVLDYPTKPLDDTPRRLVILYDVLAPDKPK